MYANPGIYKLDSNNCDTHTYEIMTAADKFYDYCELSLRVCLKTQYSCAIYIKYK